MTIRSWRAAARPGRRAVLRGAGAALALPWLEALDGRGPRPARAQAAPRRFVAVFSSNGVIQEAWRPTGAETAFELGPSLAPLLPHKSDVVVVQGLTLRCKGAVHPAAMSAWLTGTPADSTFVRGPGNAGWATGPSVDQVIAAEIAKAGRTRFRSLELGVKTESGSDLGGYRMIFSGPSQPIPPENSPLGAFSRLFASVGARPGDTAATERLLAQRRSILDAVKGEYARVQARVGAEDRARLEAHLASVREIEADLLAVGSAAPAPACGKPAVTDAADIPAIAKLHMDIIAAALACDLVRVASLQFMRSGAQNTYPWIGVDDKHHDLGHRPDGDTAARDKLVKIETWYAAQVAYLIARLKERSLLDSTLVLWGNELGVGNTHDTKNAPFVLAGRAGGRLRTGRFVKHPGASHNNLLVSVLNAFDVPATTFGLPEWCQGPLPGLVA